MYLRWNRKFQDQQPLILKQMLADKRKKKRKEPKMSPV